MRLSDSKKEVYRRLARKQGYRSRAAFKLKTISEKYRILKAGQVVIDFGCAPGGWIQVVSEQVGEKGLVIGLDLTKILPPSSNSRTIIADITQQGLVHRILKETQRKADVVLSDLSPKVSGVWELDHIRQLDLTSQVVSYMPHVLLPGGSAVLKAFEGEMLRPLVRSLHELFSKVHIAKPPASRRESSEMYLVCLNYFGKQ